MRSSELLADGFSRITELVTISLSDISTDGIAYRPEPGANSIAWLTWHLTRIQDDHVSEIAELEQAWVTDGWASRFGMESNPDNDGRGHGPDEVAAIPADADLLLAHHRAVAERTQEYLQRVDSEELDRIIDRSYDPPVSVGVRLISVISDNIQHAGQARYLHGIVSRIM